jgi:hypothetical protein
MTTAFSTSNISESTKSVFRGNGLVLCAAIAVLLTMTLFLLECARHPSLLQDDAVSLSGL